MDSIDEAGDLVGCNRVVPHVSRHDVGRVALVFDNHGGEFLLRLAGIAIVKHVRRYEGGWCEINLAEYIKNVPGWHLVGMLRFGERRNSDA
jgi:hypothetical protein